MDTSKVRDILLKELDDLMSGKADVKHAKAVSKVSAQAIYASRIELENKRIEAKLMKDTGKDRWKFIDGAEVTIPTLNMGGKK